MILDLYIDTQNRKLVKGPTDSTVIELPKLSQGNTVTFRIRCLTPTTDFNSPYDLIATTGKTLQMAIGTKAGNASTHYTEQYTWAAGGTSEDPYFTADLPMNTEAVGTLLGASSTTNVAYLEINLVENGTPGTIYSSPATIEASVIKNDTVSVPTGLTPLSAESANAVYLPQILTSPDGAKSGKVYLGNDGELHVELLS